MAMYLPVDFDKLSRLCVVDPNDGRAYDRYDVVVTPSLQDDGRTLKLFLAKQEPKTTPTDIEIADKAFNFAVDYKPWEGDLQPQEYAGHGFEQGYKRALEEMQ